VIALWVLTVGFAYWLGRQVGQMPGPTRKHQARPAATRPQLPEAKSAKAKPKAKEPLPNGNTHEGVKVTWWETHNGIPAKKGWVAAPYWHHLRPGTRVVMSSRHKTRVFRVQGNNMSATWDLHPDDWEDLTGLPRRVGVSRVNVRIERRKK
jgi:hypothetical protein